MGVGMSVVETGIENMKNHSQKEVALSWARPSPQSKGGAVGLALGALAPYYGRG